MREDGGVDGLIYRPFADWVAGAFGVQVDVLPQASIEDMAARLNAETRNFMQSKEIAARLASEGARFVAMTPDQFGSFVKAEIAKWAPVVKASGARAD